eukprot:1983569-Rhodomonas_salina.2
MTERPAHQRDSELGGERGGRGARGADGCRGGVFAPSICPCDAMRCDAMRCDDVAALMQRIVAPVQGRA